MNDILLRALKREPTPYTPIWLMRQAGRYLAEYNATRKRAGSFMGLATNPDLATEVTIQPLDRYALDAAIVFSDILTVPDAMGLGLHFVEHEGPRFQHPLRDEAAIRALQVPSMEKLNYVFAAISQIRKTLDGRVPLIGFSGSPWTLACYMIEGHGGSDFETARTLLYKRPDLLEHILRTNTEAITQYLHQQVKAGAQVLMLFDSWGGLLAHQHYQKYSLNFMQQIIAQLRQLADCADIPIIVFTKGGGPWLTAIANSGCDAVGLDWSVDIKKAREKIGHQVALQGNLDPAILLGSEQSIINEAHAVLDCFGAHPGHIFNLGHGISRHTPPEAVSILVETVHQHSAMLRA